MGLNVGVCLVEARTRMGVAERLVVLLLIAALCSSQLLVDYRIVPYTGDLSRFATLVLLRPAHCLFEMWAAQTPNWKDRPHSTMSIVVDVLREADNSTFILPQKYPVPLCKDFPRAPLEPAYQMGPRIACRNGSCIENVLPGQAFRIRYTLQDVSGKPLIMTQWSDAISTKDEPASYVSIQVWDAGLRSGSMVVITVLLAVAVFILIVGFATSVTMGWR